MSAVLQRISESPYSRPTLKSEVSVDYLLRGLRERVNLTSIEIERVTSLLSQLGQYVRQNGYPSVAQPTIDKECIKEALSVAVRKPVREIEFVHFKSPGWLDCDQYQRFVDAQCPWLQDIQESFADHMQKIFDVYARRGLDSLTIKILQCYTQALAHECFQVHPPALRQESLTECPVIAGLEAGLLCWLGGAIVLRNPEAAQRVCKAITHIHEYLPIGNRKDSPPHVARPCHKIVLFTVSYLYALIRITLLAFEEHLLLEGIFIFDKISTNDHNASAKFLK